MKVLDQVRPTALPAEALLCRYQDGKAYVDCFVARVSAQVTQAEFISAFYTTWLFRIERLILKIAASRPSSDEEAVALGLGQRDQFAAWKVERRSANQLLLCDFTGRTRSWLMTVSEADAKTAPTRLYFGSAVVPRIDPATGQSGLGAGFSLLLGFHKLYSRLLLRAACTRLRRI